MCIYIYICQSRSLALSLSLSLALSLSLSLSLSLFLSLFLSLSLSLSFSLSLSLSTNTQNNIEIANFIVIINCKVYLIILLFGHLNIKNDRLWIPAIEAKYLCLMVENHRTIWAGGRDALWIVLTRVLVGQLAFFTFETFVGILL